MMTSPTPQPIKRPYSRRTPAEILLDNKKERFEALSAEIKEIRKHDWPGRPKSNETLKKELELLRLQKELKNC